MYVTYGKPSAQPQSGVGEQKGKSSWDDENKAHYPKNGRPAFTGHRVHLKENSGGGGSHNGNDYPKSPERFGTERGV